METVLYGIRNCATVKKARAWLDAHGVRYRFHDYKVSGIDRGTLQLWDKELGWEALLNRAGTTFRKLADRDKRVTNARAAISLMMQLPSIIKRPMLDHDGRLTVGFRPEIYERSFRLRAK